MKGKLITFEGSEGSGKSTQIGLLKKYLKKNKKSVLFFREPGGVKISEKIRRLLLDVINENMSPACELFLYMAARAQLVDEAILPQLEKGNIVLCDRFLDSTVAYQGYGNGADIGFIKKLGDYATKGVKPDLTIVFDLEAEKGLSRINRKKDRIEQRAVSYHQKVQNGYLDIARKEPKRVKVIKVNKTKEEIHAQICQYVDGLI